MLSCLLCLAMTIVQSQGCRNGDGRAQYPGFSQNSCFTVTWRTTFQLGCGHGAITTSKFFASSFFLGTWVGAADDDLALRTCIIATSARFKTRILFDFRTIMVSSKVTRGAHISFRSFYSYPWGKDPYPRVKDLFRGKNIGKL